MSFTRIEIDKVHDCHNCHNGMGITKIVVSPKYAVTYSQEDESFVGWCIEKDKYIPGNEVKHRLSNLDFKVSDKRVIMYEVIENNEADNDNEANNDNEDESNESNNNDDEYE